MARLPAVCGEGIGLIRFLMGVVKEMKRMDRELQELRKAAKEKEPNAT